MGKFEPSRLIAAVAVFADKTAAPVVARPHFSPHGERVVTSPPNCIGGGGGGGLGLLGSRLAGDAGLAFVDLSQERIERALDDLAGVAVRDLVGEQILKLFELVARILTEGHLEPVAAR